MTPQRRLGPAWLLAAGVVCAPALAGAQTWGELRLPGGVQAARQMVDTGTNSGRPDALWLLDVVRRLQGPTEAEERINQLRDYLAYLEVLAPLAKTCPEQCQLVPRSAPSAARDRVRRLTEALGLDRKDNDQRVELDTWDGARRKHAWLAALGIDVKKLAETLNAKSSIVIPLVDSVLPLPVPDYFRQQVLRPGRSDVMAIVGDRRTARLYAALMSCDEATLQTLAAKPELLVRVHEEHSAHFVVAGRTLRLRADRVETPGDAGAVAIWEDLVGRKVTDVDRFTRDLLRRDSGRLAYFYSIVAQLDERRQAFVLGRHLPAKDRVRYVDRIYQRFVGLDSAWQFESAPFLRPDFDPQVMFALVDVADDGTIGPAWWPSLFERSRGTAVWSDAPVRTLKALKDERADALWLISWVFEQPAEAANRFRLVRFAQRQFAKQPRAAAPAMAVALGAVIQFPVLPLALERMGVSDPAVYQLLGLAAHGLNGDGERELAELQRWQTALALFEQIQRRHPSSDATRIKMLTALGSLALLPKNQRPGSVGAWVADVLLPAFVRGEADSRDRDLVLMEALFTSPQPAPLVTWEGLEYVFDPVAVQMRAAAAIQRAARVPHVFDVATLHQVRRELEAGVTSTKAVQAIVDRLKTVTDAVDALPPVDEQPARAVREFAEIMKNLERLITRPKEVGRANRQVPALREVIDDLTDAAMKSVTYALATVPTGEAPGMFAGRWARHFFTPFDPTASRTSIAWTLAHSEPSPVGGTVVRGSWLGLDVALAEGRLRRVGVPIGPGMATIGDSDRLSLLSRLVIDTPGPLDAASFGAVVKGVSEGRARLLTWASAAPADRELEGALRNAGVSAEAANAMRWLAKRADARAFSTIGSTALYRLGTGKPLPEGWGAVSVIADGCWCAIKAPAGGADALAGRRGAGLNVSLDTDLAVRLAELLAAVRVPSVTWPALLPFALQDWLDGVRQFSLEDGESIAVWPRQLDATRFEQYLLMLVADGVFAPPKGGVW